MAYNEFARIYDTLMNDVPYDAWAEFILKKAGNITEAVDGACGTGNIAQRLAMRGVKVTAFDISREMLGLAQEKARKNGLTVRYLEQDLTEFELTHKTDLITVCCDGINYLTEDGEMQACFECVYDSLKDDGLFIFDISSEYKLANMDGQMYGDDGDEVAYMWNNTVDGNVLEMSLSFFCREKGGLYKRFDETHYQRIYKYDEVMNALKKAGFGGIEVYDSYTYELAQGESERLTFLCRKTED